MTVNHSLADAVGSFCKFKSGKPIVDVLALFNQHLFNIAIKDSLNCGKIIKQTTNASTTEENILRKFFTCAFNITSTTDIVNCTKEEQGNTADNSSTAIYITLGFLLLFVTLALLISSFVPRYYNGFFESSGCGRRTNGDRDHNQPRNVYGH